MHGTIASRLDRLYIMPYLSILLQIRSTFGTLTSLVATLLISWLIKEGVASPDDTVNLSFLKPL